MAPTLSVQAPAVGTISAGHARPPSRETITRHSTLAKPGSFSLLLEGPPYRLSLSWCLSHPGSECVGLCLWLFKDWSWSQLRWTVTAVFFAFLAVVWLGGMVVAAFRSGLYSEVYLGSGLFLWLLANVLWMVGEFSSLWWAAAGAVDATDGPDYEGWGEAAARYLLLTSALLFAVYFAMLAPLDVFRSDRQSDVLRRIERTSPPCPPHVVGYFREFRVWSSLHLFAWSVKDCLWAWGLAVPYAFAFLFTIMLTLDLLWRFGTHSLQYVNFVHTFITLLWVVANGMWVIGEFFTEVDLSPDDYRSYRFIALEDSDQRNPAFKPRWVAGCVFLFAGLVLTLFYVQWVVISSQGWVPSYDEFAGTASSTDHPEEGTSYRLEGDGAVA